MPGDSDIYRGQVDQRTPLNVALCAIWYRLWQLGGFNQGGAGGVVVTPQTVTPNFHAIAASGTFTIPAGAKGWTAAILTGTGTIGGIAIAVPFSDSDDNTLASGITVTTDSASTAFVRWNT